MNSFANFPTRSSLAVSKDDRATVAICALFALLVAAQVFLVFTKSINWDEFYHYSMVHDLPKGRLTWDFQTLYIRLFLWVPRVTDDLILQIQLARLGMLCFQLVAVAMVVRLAREFVDRKSALVTGIVYLGGGYVFTQGFSFRADPVATAILMTALYQFATQRLTSGRMVAVGALVGLAGLVTIKSIFYVPCFVAFAIRRLIDSPADRRGELVRIAAIPIVSVATFITVLQLHRLGLDVREAAVSSLGSRVSAFLGDGPGQRAAFIINQIGYAPLIPVSLLLCPVIWRHRPGRDIIALVGLVLPVLTLLFYRNTFPYFFVFLLAPVCVGIAPVIDQLLKRLSIGAALVGLAISPAALLATQQYDVIHRQRALIDEVHRLFPAPTGYLAYAGFIADYPRILPHLISGVGLKAYYDRGIPVIAREIERGNVAFALADSEPVSAALEGRTMPETLQPRDFRMLHENFVHYEGAIWIAGKTVCAAPAEQSIMIYRAGAYSVDGGRISIDGAVVDDGGSLVLAAGQHRVLHQTGGCIKLWALPAVPRVPDGYPDGTIVSPF